MLTCSLWLEAGDLGHDLCKGVPGVGEGRGHRLQLHQERDKNSALANFVFLFIIYSCQAICVVKNIISTGSVAQNKTGLVADLPVPYHESQDRDVILVRRTILLGKPRGVRKLEWGGNGEGVGGGRSVHEQPGTKVDGIAPRKRRDSK